VVFDGSRPECKDPETPLGERPMCVWRLHHAAERDGDDKDPVELVTHSYLDGR
jgi:hypothetical protein